MEETQINVSENTIDYSFNINNEQVSKHIFIPSDAKLETVPNAMVVGTINEVGVERIKPATIPKWLLSHPALERGIEFKFNRMIKQLDKDEIGNNILPKDDSNLAVDAKKYITTIFKNSNIQPVSWIKQYGRDAMRFGDNYMVLIPAKSGKEIVKWELQNPIFFSPMFDMIGEKGLPVQTQSRGYTGLTREQDQIKYRINPKTKKPSQYTQLKKQSSMYPSGMTGGKNQDPKSMRFIPVGKLFDASRVVQLNFDRIGDEPFGIPLLQTIWNVVKQILRVEDAGTETMIAFGYNRWIANTQFRTQEKMQQFAQSIENIRKRSVVVLPEGVDLDSVKPGSTEFDKVHNLLLELIAMRIGISLIQLKGTGGDINRSTLNSFMDDIRHDFFADELELESAINEAIIKSCAVRYDLRSSEEKNNFPYPIFRFFTMEEDEDRKATRLLKQSLSLRNIAYSVQILTELGYNQQSRLLVNNYIETLIPKQETQEDFSAKSHKQIIEGDVIAGGVQPQTGTNKTAKPDKVEEPKEDVPQTQQIEDKTVQE